jgi:serralysin
MRTLPLLLALAACAGGADDTDPTADTDVVAGPDADGDGTLDAEDCAPDDPTIHPGAAETCDGVDQDCDGVTDDQLASSAEQASDNGNDGTVDARYHFEFDAEYRVTEQLSDRENDGAWDHAYRTVYPTPGERDYAVTGDEGVDGDIDYAVTADYDAKGMEVYNVADYNGDDEIDHLHRATNTYEGDLVVKIAIDDGDNGSIDAIRTFAYDAQGRITLETTDDNADGNLDLQATWAWAADGLSVVISYATDTVTDVVTREFDADGLVIAEASEGVNNWRRESTYDDAGNVTSGRQDYDGDGDWDYTYTYTYDDQGRPAAWAYDSNGDGVIDGSATRTYTCGG